jgi:hypothetical protein
MTFAADRITDAFIAPVEAVPSAVAAFNRLSVDDQLGLLWVIYENLGGLMTPAAPGAARTQFIEGLLNQFKQMEFNQQLEAMRDLARKVSTPISRSYGAFTANNKLAFWYMLAEGMKNGEIIPVPSYYKLSASANALFNTLTFMEFNQQITFLRQCVINMGIDPLA